MPDGPSRSEASRPARPCASAAVQVAVHASLGAGQHGGDDAREDVARAGGREAADPGMGDAHALASRGRDERVGALEQDDAPALLRRPPHRLEPVCAHPLGRLAEQPAHLALVRRQHGRRGPAAQRLQVAVEREQAVGVDHDRARRGRCRPRARARSPPARGRGPGPSATASARSSSSRAFGSGRTITSGTRASRMRAASGGVAIHTIPADARRAASAAISGAPEKPRAPPITSTAPAVYFVSDGLLARRGQAVGEHGGRGHVGLRRDADVGDDDAPRRGAARLDCGPELAAVEAHRQLGGHGGAGDHPGRRVDARGHVQGDDAAAARRSPRSRARHRACGAPLEPGAEQRVHDHVGPPQARPATRRSRIAHPEPRRRSSWFRRASGGQPGGVGREQALDLPPGRRAGGGRPRTRRRRCCRRRRRPPPSVPAKRAQDLLRRRRGRPAPSARRRGCRARRSRPRRRPASRRRRTAASVRIMRRRRRPPPPPSPSSGSC